MNNNNKILIAITGAGGAIGRVLRPRLLAQGFRLAAMDIAALTPSSPDETVYRGDLRDGEVANAVLSGAQMVIHLAGSSVERDLATIIENNLVALESLYEGALRHKIRRVIFASSNHTIGMYPAGERLTLDDPPRPDGFYGLSKVWGEAMGQLYWDKHGIETVAIRIGSALPKPLEPRHLSTWLGEDDMEALFLRALLAEKTGFMKIWGVSANTASWWDNAGAAELGYEPRQNAAEYAAEILAHAGAPAPRDAYQGGAFALAGLGRNAD
jgi:uronate dehydrogenase